jgi:hypothetical protein
MAKIFQECAQLVKQIVGHEFLYFDTKLELKLTPHSIPFNAWAVCVSPKNELFVMDSEEQWHQVEESNSLMVATIYQRIKTIPVRCKDANEEVDTMQELEIIDEPFAHQIFEKEEGI